MTRILLIGAAGQVGSELRQALPLLYEVIGVDRHQLNLTDAVSLRRIVHDTEPDVIINAAAYTAVDRAESEPALAYAVNAVAPTLLAEEAKQLGAALVHISTDYVFDGCHHTPYTETDCTNPISVYGRSKLEGEAGIQQACDRHLILRTAWVYGTFGKSNFVKTMLRLGQEREEIRVVSDQIGSPTWARDIANAIAQLLPRICTSEAPLTGIYHFTNSGSASWYDFAVAIFEEAEAIGMPLALQRVVPIMTTDYPTPAKRPAYSLLALQKITATLGASPDHWRRQLRHMLTELHLNQHESTHSLRR